MKVGTLLLILGDVFAILKTMGIIAADGTMRAPTAKEDAVLASRVEMVLKDHGVNIPDQVDKVLLILPLILSLAGVK